MRNFNLEFVITDDGKFSVSGTNEGFTPFELLGLLDWKKRDIEKQIFKEIKPDIVSRKVIKD